MHVEDDQWVQGQPKGLYCTAWWSSNVSIHAAIEANVITARLCIGFSIARFRFPTYLPNRHFIFYLWPFDCLEIRTTYIYDNYLRWCIRGSESEDGGTDNYLIVGVRYGTDHGGADITGRSFSGTGRHTIVAVLFHKKALKHSTGLQLAGFNGSSPVLFDTAIRKRLAGRHIIISECEIYEGSTDYFLPQHDSWDLESTYYIVILGIYYRGLHKCAWWSTLQVWETSAAHIPKYVGVTVTRLSLSK